MASYLPYQVPYQNQLQFNLGVPLMTQNLTANYQRPSPIIVERVGGQHAIPAQISTQKLQGSPVHTDQSGGNYSVLSEDKMEVLSQLAKRDLKNRALQAQIGNNNASAGPSPLRGRSQKQHVSSGKAQNIHCSRLRSQQQRARIPQTAKEAEKNRRFGAVQTPPPHRSGSHTRVANDSVLSQKSVTLNTTQETDIFFPVKPTLPNETHNSDEIAKIQQEMEGYLHLVERIVDRALEEHSTNFLRPPTRGKQKDGFLTEEEGYDRARARVGEQNTRSVRNLYNLRQKVKHLQRDVVQADLNKPAKKNQIMIQLVVIYRGAGKAVQTFVNQLPYQDLTAGLPAHFHELTLLLKQLVGLASLVRLGKPGGPEQGGLLTLLETIEALDAKWRVQLKSSGPNLMERRERKPVASRGWVSDTKVDKDIFVTRDRPGAMVATALQPKKIKAAQQNAPKKQQHNLQRQPRAGRQVRTPWGKENRRDLKGKREELRSGISALLQQKEAGKGLGTDGTSRDPPHPVAWEVDISKKPYKQDPRKGYLLPSDLIDKRERAQRAVEASNQKDWRFADPTVSSKLKTSLRPSSAPPSPE
ncbi:protein moonraker [Plakobranchus ocellatus]|uniref:Protein moonraker n=1 Tax=Plakobranchus ocellatus TaxID=259542 RepID=A0AAV4B9W2_9GAST|nr:protein moonraker [Plakobranchus ocellatus]